MKKIKKFYYRITRNKCFNNGYSYVTMALKNERITIKDLEMTFPKIETAFELGVEYAMDEHRKSSLHYRGYKYATESLANGKITPEGLEDVLNYEYSFDRGCALALMDYRREQDEIQG